MIRGKKNFLPPSHLVLGLSFLFRLEDGSIERHKGERKVVYGNDDAVSITESDVGKDEVEIEVLDKSDDEEDAENHPEESNNKLQAFPELNTEGVCNIKNSTIDEDGKENEDSEEESIKSNSDEDDQEESKFPDTQIKIQHFEGTKINVLTEPTQTNNKEEDTETIVYLGDNNPVVLKSRSRVNSENKQKQLKPLSKQSESKEDIKMPQQQIKRGQKSKMRKIKEKYKDQDDEERELRMTILQVQFISFLLLLSKPYTCVLLS